jgi:hypothetical protein
MTKEEKAAWAQANSADTAGKIQADPHYQDKNQQAKSIYNLQTEQKTLHEKIESRKAGILRKLKTLDQNAAAMRTKEIDPLQREFSSLGGLVISKKETDRIDHVNMKLNNAKKRYCETYSHQYLTLLDEYLSCVKASLPDYQRMEKIIAKTQTGFYSK